MEQNHSKTCGYTGEPCSCDVRKIYDEKKSEYEEGYKNGYEDGKKASRKYWKKKIGGSNE